MLLGFVVLYLVLSIAIGLYAASRVRNSTDYIVAGRRLPLYITIATVFATWFGSETVFGISATFLEGGLNAITADPFGSSMCLILVGVFFARPLYRMNLLTIGDYYRRRYNRPVELATSLAIVLSYLGWVSAQLIALGLVFSLLTGGAITMTQGIVLGAAIVLVYTLFGGMWSVALTDFFQMTIICAGMIYIAFVVSDLAGGVDVVVNHAADAGKLEFLPALTAKDIIAFVAAWMTIGLGSIPQQDVFQRVMSAKNENIAAWGSIIGGSLYFVFAFIPVFLAYSAFLIDPAMVEATMKDDSQLILPNLILNHTPLFAQVMFFGAILSAIMSTASGTLLAPSATFTENILKGFLPNMDDTQFLLALRVVVVTFAICVTLFAINSDSTIFEMVENAYKVTLSCAFVPLAFGVYWKRATTQGAVLAIVFGLTAWITMEIVAPEGTWPPQLVGLLASTAGMVVGSLAPQRVASDHPVAARHPSL
ncbi:MAG: sodium:solute symporter family protein [Burkholderiales bacterium]